MKIYIPSSHFQERSYILGIIFEEFLGVTCKLIPKQEQKHYEIVLENGNKLIINDCFFKNFSNELDYLRRENVPEKIQSTTNQFLVEKNIPIIFGNDELVVSEDKIICGIDIFASAFFMLTRWEEYVNKTRDEHARFPSTASLAYKSGFLDRPVVNEYVEMLRNMLIQLGYRGKRKKYWGDKTFAVALTHDIDEIKKYRRPPVYTIMRNLRKKNIKKIKDIIWSYLKTKLGLEKDPYLKTFNYIIDLEKKYNFSSSFYFMANNKRYSLRDNDLKEIITKLKENNFEIGIHPGFNSYNKAKLIKKEKEKLEIILGQKLLGGRQHYLKFNVPESYRNWELADLKYDSSMGFNDYEGFRCGICHPFRPFDVLENKIIDVWEIPLILMDGTLFSSRKLSLGRMKKITDNLLENVEKYNGIFVLLWHNGCMTELFTPKEKAFFENFYKVISQKDCLVESAEKILNLWKNKEI